MKQSIKQIFPLMLFLLCAKAIAADTTVMQCQLTNGREVNVQWDGEGLTYTYGKKNQPTEINLPNDPNDVWAVTTGSASFASGQAIYYRFKNGDYSYVTYFSETNDGTTSELGIFKGAKVLKWIKCKDYFHTQLENIYTPPSAPGRGIADDTDDQVNAFMP